MSDYRGLVGSCEVMNVWLHSWLRSRTIGGLVLALLVITAGAQASGSDLDETIQSMNLQGDLRLRGEFDDKPDALDRWRPRMRVRLGAKFTLNDEFRVGLRVTTGNPNDPRSPHQTLGSAGGKFDLSLDRAYLDYKPSSISGLRLTGGKFGHRLRRPAVYGELVLDADIQPTGVLATWSRSGSAQVDVGMGEYLLNESSSGEDSHAFVGQIAITHGDNDGTKISVVGDVFLLFIGEGTPAAKLGHPSGRGNLVRSIAEQDFFLSDFRILQAFAEVSHPVSGKPFTLSGGFVINTEAISNDDSAFFLGAKLGKVSKPRDWRLFAQYQEVEQEAVFTPWAQDDFADDRGSRFRGVVTGAEVGIKNNVKLRCWVLGSALLGAESGENDSWVTRYRADINTSF